MKSIQEIFKELQNIMPDVKTVIAHSDIENAEDLSGIIYNKENAEDLFLVEETRQILEKLQDVTYAMNYLKRPVIREGVLVKQANGRFAMHSAEHMHDYEFTCGSSIECLLTDDWHTIYDEETDEYKQVPYWFSGRIEHNGTNYYITGASISNLEGLRVRIR